MKTSANRSSQLLAERAVLLAEWERSGLSQREFSEERGIPVRTFEYYRRQQLRRQTGSPRRREPVAEAAQLVPVQITASAPPAAISAGGFALTLPNGRRIEAAWEFCETALARLLRVAEQA